MVKLQQRNMQLTRMYKKSQATLGICGVGENTTAAHDNLTDPPATISWRSKNETFKRQVTEAINNVVVRHTHWSLKREGALIAQAVWALDGTLLELLNLSRKHFRENVFTF